MPSRPELQETLRKQVNKLWLSAHNHSWSQKLRAAFPLKSPRSQSTGPKFHSSPPRARGPGAVGLPPARRCRDPHLPDLTQPCSGPARLRRAFRVAALTGRGLRKPSNDRVTRGAGRRRTRSADEVRGGRSKETWNQPERTRDPPHLLAWT